MFADVWAEKLNTMLTQVLRSRPWVRWALMYALLPVPVGPIYKEKAQQLEAVGCIVSQHGIYDRRVTEPAGINYKQQ
jgi:hypothetical protein